MASDDEKYDKVLQMAKNMSIRDDITSKISSIAYYTMAIGYADNLGQDASDLKHSVQRIADSISASVATKQDFETPSVEPISANKLSVQLSDLVGMAREKIEIERTMINPYIFPKLFKKVKGGMMMYGPPGTGKTMIAKATTNAIYQRSGGNINVHMFNADSAGMKSKWQGATEKQIKSYFIEAEKIAKADMAECRAKGNKNKCTTLSIIFMDEFDAIAGDRNGDDQSMTHSVNALISNMDGIVTYENVIVMAATNKPWSIDPAIRRRFASIVFVDLPTDNARSESIHKILKEHYGEIEKINSQNLKKFNILDFIAEITKLTGVNSSAVFKLSNARASKFNVEQEVRDKMYQHQLPIEWLEGRQPSDQALSRFGYSMSDLEQVVTRAINIAAERATNFVFNASDQSFHSTLENARYTDQAHIKTGTIVSITDIRTNYAPFMDNVYNYILTMEDFHQAIAEYPSTLVDREYVQYIYYSKYGKQLVIPEQS